MPGQIPHPHFLEAFGHAPGAVGRAPGRVNLIGEHTDYNGGLVLPAAISLTTACWVRLRDDARVRGVSRELGAAEAELGDPPAGTWLDYPRGVWRELAAVQRASGRGFELLVESDVPAGAGLSSSAALEVSAGLALAAASGAPFSAAERPELARLCQRAEVGFVGVPCGIMDPYACARAGGGGAGAVLLDCATLEAEPLSLPSHLALLLIDTGVRRRLADTPYARRRLEGDAALEGARRALGRELGSLSEIGIEELESLAGSLEAVAARRVRHVVSENARVRAFAAAIRAGSAPAAGAELYASHASLARDYDASCTEADRLVAASHDVPGLHGARIVGAGWGGCTLHLVDAASAEAAARTLSARLDPPRHWLLHPAEADPGRPGRETRS